MKLCKDPADSHYNVDTELVVFMAWENLNKLKRLLER